MLKAFRKNGEKGFTLIELMIVIAIIGLLAAIGIPQFMAYKKRGYLASCVADGKLALTGVTAWVIENTGIPPAETIAPHNTGVIYTSITTSSGNTITIAAGAAAGTPGVITVTSANLAGSLIVDAAGNMTHTLH